MKTHRWSLDLLSFLLVLIGMALPAVAAAAAPATRVVPGERASADAPLVADKIREAMQDRRYADAVKAIDEAVGSRTPKTPRATTCSISKAGRCTSTASTTRRSPSSTNSARSFPKAPGHAGHALPRPSRWPARATSAARVDLSGRGRVPALDRSQAADRRHLPGVRRHLFQAAQGRAEARLRQGPGVLQEGPGDRGQAGEADRDRAARSASASRTWKQAGRSGRAVREVHQGPSQEPLGYRSPLAAGHVPPGGRQRPRGPAGLAGPAGQVCRFAVAARGRRPVRSVANLEHPQPARRRAIEPGHRRLAGLSGTLPQACQRRPGPPGNRPELSQPRPARQTPRPP